MRWKRFAKHYLLAEAVIERESRIIDSEALHALLNNPVTLDLSDEAAAQKSAVSLAGLYSDTKNVKIDSKYDEKSESHILRISRTQHGVARSTMIDNDFLQSGDYAQIRKTAQMLHGLLGDGAYIKRGEQRRPVRDFREAIDWLLAEVQRSVGIQRYKGLGEMNPEQLWDTTMNPKTRRLLRTRIDDAIGADEIFTTLMGDAVEPRRAFIETNALGVRNLDI